MSELKRAMKTLTFFTDVSITIALENVENLSKHLSLGCRSHRMLHVITVQVAVVPNFDLRVRVDADVFFLGSKGAVFFEQLLEPSQTLVIQVKIIGERNISDVRKS